MERDFDQKVPGIDFLEEIQQRKEAEKKIRLQQAAANLWLKLTWKHNKYF